MRRAQAAATRARIGQAAAAVFARQGYEGARIEDIAFEAGVTYPTVYKVFANKRKLLKAAVDSAMTGGPDGEVARQAWFREQLEAPDAEQQLRLVARNARRLYDRAGKLLEAVRAAAAGDEDIAALWQDIHDDRLGRSRTTARRLAQKAKLRVTTKHAARTLWTLTVLRSTATKSTPPARALRITSAGWATCWSPLCSNAEAQAAGPLDTSPRSPGRTSRRSAGA